MEKQIQEKMEIIYPKKPNRDPNKDKGYYRIRVICNMKRLNLGEGMKQVQQYAIHYEPVIAEDNYSLKRKIIRQLNRLKSIFQFLEKYNFYNLIQFFYHKISKMVF